MRAKHVTVGMRVRIIKGVTVKTFGTVEDMQGDLIAVRKDGETKGTICKSGDLVKVVKPA